MAIRMPPFALTLSISRHNQIEVQFPKNNGVFQIEPSLEETLAMEAIGVAANFVQLINFAGNVVHGGNNLFHSMRRFRKEHKDLTDELTRAFELLQVLETIVGLLPAPQDQRTEACMDCGLQSSQIQGLDLTRLSLLDQLTREFPNYKARFSKAERILSKSTPSVGQPLRSFLRQFAWHFKKQVLHDLLFALERGKSSFMIIFHLATLKRFDDFLAQNGSPSNQPTYVNMYGWTPLHQASIIGNADLVSRLLEGPQTDINSRDKEGMTALDHAAERGHVEVVRILLENGATPLEKDKYGREALAIALASCENTPARIIFEKVLQSSGLQIILKTYAPINQTILHQIANLGYVKGVEQLLKLGADPHAEDNWGYTPVHLAARKGHTQIVTILLQAISATGRKLRASFCGHTPLQLAAKHGHDVTVDAILSSHQADCNVRDFLGFTPLHSAAAAGQFSVVETLLPLTDIFTPTEVHVPSPFQLAQWGGHKSILRLLHFHYFGPRVNSEFQFPALEFRADALREIEFVSTRFKPRANFPYQLNAVCYLAEQYGLIHLKSGRFDLASAWYDIALITHPLNSSVTNPAEVVNPIKACDHCSVKPIKGPCYTCTTCIGPCYDLCSTCFPRRSHLHKHQNYLMVPSSSDPLPSFEAHLRILEKAMKGTFTRTEDKYLRGIHLVDLN